jgi:hypothetical protein
MASKVLEIVTLDMKTDGEVIINFARDFSL